MIDPERALCTLPSLYPDYCPLIAAINYSAQLLRRLPTRYSTSRGEPMSFLLDYWAFNRILRFYVELIFWRAHMSIGVNNISNTFFKLSNLRRKDFNLQIFIILDESDLLKTQTFLKTQVNFRHQH